MPQSYYNVPEHPESTGLGLNHLSNVCPSPLTPPPDQGEQRRHLRSYEDHQIRARNVLSSDNTATGMAQSQEDSIYLTPAATPEMIQDTFCYDEKDKMDIVHEECRDGTKTPLLISTYQRTERTVESVSSASQSSVTSPCIPFEHFQHPVPQLDDSALARQGQVEHEPLKTSGQPALLQDRTPEDKDEAFSQGLAPIDLLFNRSLGTNPWTFSNRRLLPEYPSHVFQSFSQYSGTQQSDRQVYNVDVTILTVDMAQCTMSGYLTIKGLTPEHDTLQTYFTGEIIGGSPRFSDDKQHYNFRTANSSWGATEKTDLTHWARFSAWRSLASHAKRDINFEYPTDGGNWWEQENIFMRWKEHFLVPDHKTKSIAGASFEGFYYICLNQVQGRISGIYYHSKSEKYQRLELKHEGKPDVLNMGITPCVEFR